MEKQYKVRIEPYKKHFKSDRLVILGNESYLVTITKSNIGNEPKVYTAVKTLASKLIEEGQVEKDKPFTITIKQ